MSTLWLVARGSGLVAYALLAAAVIWGLLLSTKILDRTVPARQLTWVHESLSLTAVAATLLHMVALGLEDFIDYGLRVLLVPGASGFRPVPVALGVIAFWTLAVVTPSFYLRSKIGQKMWRTIHFATFGAFASAAIHGITAGTDSGQPAVIVLYAVTVTLVLALTTLRIIRTAAKTPGEGQSRAAAERIPAELRRKPADAEPTTPPPAKKERIPGELRRKPADAEPTTPPPAKRERIPAELRARRAARDAAGVP